MPPLVQRIRPRSCHLLIARRLRRHVRQLFGNRTAGDGNAIAVDAVIFEQDLQYLRNAASAMEIHRDEAPRRLQVAQHRSVTCHALEVFDIPFHPRRFRDGEKMKHSVGRAASRHHNRDRVGDGLLRDDVTRLEIRLNCPN
jgi:hypothetical protein